MCQYNLRKWKNTQQPASWVSTWRFRSSLWHGAWTEARPDFSGDTWPALPSWCICPGLLSLSPATWCFGGEKPHAPDTGPLMGVQWQQKLSLWCRKIRWSWSMSSETQVFHFENPRLQSTPHKGHRMVHLSCPLNTPPFPRKHLISEPWELLQSPGLDLSALVTGWK